MDALRARIPKGRSHGHDHRRETFALYEYGRAEILLGKLEDGLSTLDNVLQITADEDAKDFEFIIDIERKIALTLRKLDRENEADEIARRLDAVTEVIDEA